MFDLLQNLMPRGFLIGAALLLFSGAISAASDLGLGLYIGFAFFAVVITGGVVGAMRVLSERRADDLRRGKIAESRSRMRTAKIEEEIKNVRR